MCSVSLNEQPGKIRLVQLNQMLRINRSTIHSSYSERLVSFLFSAWRCPSAAAASMGTEGAHLRWCSAAESQTACVVAMEINKRTVEKWKNCRKKLLSFRRSGIRSEGMWLKQSKYSSCLQEQQLPKWICYLSPFTLYKRYSPSVSILLSPAVYWNMLVSHHPHMQRMQRARPAPWKVNKWVTFEIFPAFSQSLWEFCSLLFQWARI